MIFIADLEGSFTTGTLAERQHLYEILRDQNDLTQILFTQHGLEFCLAKLNDPVIPNAHFVIAENGATVVEGETFSGVMPLQTEIEQKWPGSWEVRQTLGRFEGVRAMHVPRDRSAQFKIDELSNELVNAISKLGCSYLVEGEEMLGIYPQGVSIASTLLSLLDARKLSSESIILVIDNIKHLDLFHELKPFNCKAIITADIDCDLQENALLDDNLFMSSQAGSLAIIEGLSHFKVLTEKQSASIKSALPSPQSEAGSDLVIVYHRLPFVESNEQGRTSWKQHKSPNGIIPSLLEYFSGGKTGSWVAWTKRKKRSDGSDIERVKVEEEKYPGLTLARVGLTESDVKKFYHTFSKEAFWPIIFSFPEKAVFKEADWKHYQEINSLFANKANTEAAFGATIWIHDYNLWLVPGMLRAIRPDLKISFFHHTSFPAPDVFNIIPWRDEIISSLLQCDFVGFHIPRYVNNFLDVVRSYAPVTVTQTTSSAPRFMSYGSALSVDSYPTIIESTGRKILLGADPVGINAERIDSILSIEQVRLKAEEIREQTQNLKIILSVERLDYVKGPLQKLEAYEKLLERDPSVREKVVLINICTPPAPGMEVYDSIRKQVDRCIGRINGRFGTVNWNPVLYFYRSLPFDEVVSFYLASDICWITPLRDGLNLVAKEYVATKSAMNDLGVLVLSEFAGASVEMFGAVLTNPYDIEDMVASLSTALSMDEQEKKVRMERLASCVRSNEILHWGNDFMERFSKIEHMPAH